MYVNFGGGHCSAYDAFNKSLGQIGSKFAGFGALDSSGFQNAVSGAGKELASGLQSQRTGLQTNAVNQLLGHAEKLLGNNPYALQKENSFGGDFGEILAKVLPSLLALL